MLVCGGRKNKKKRKPVSRVTQVEALPAMKRSRYQFNAVGLKGEVYVFSGMKSG